MNPSVFEHVDNRLSQRNVEIRDSKNQSDWDVSDIMSTAGKTLFEAISSNKIDLGDIPDWFRKEPKGPEQEDLYGTLRPRYNWDLYWAFAIKEN